ncbi:aerobic-type carbon monoxide dehydrogenase, middle subunit CoxM/CutM-like protein [Desulfosporosinus orientis DSM 765]|uniref:Aerobic-type carbon monoxide dehydrogenase, middle subunit CoxM/CutM-like protein n=1 Tax=Desulfosporosinus orientis (strain ATCC 19365 / DSM 765 / NCIMB 8382 / VKM B-1628 / Singapore I) TaxID=768706 RepID=G7W7T2_DESOD|nr:xanthine dehydrogenase family protein subunit M [Desulfosporosinus orientis]AET66147.1 aerobic-type carbon monoxide dehydrogenase, middle subunit CoxM/CutM-like protein [Desulfosporosinus orientis DSM 765]
MSRFKYYRPKCLDEAFKLMAENPGYSLLAGGTDLMVKLKESLIKPTAVIDLDELEELKGINLEAGEIVLGASTTHTRLNQSELINQYAPALAKAAGIVGSPQIRNKGTVGGNMVNASPAADTVPALIALGAEVTLSSKEAVKTIPLDELFLGPGRTVLKPGELITTISFQVSNHQGCSFQKLGKRKALAISVINASASLEIDPETRVIKKARIALGSVAATAIRGMAGEKILIGNHYSPELIKEAAEAVAEAIKPIDDVRSTAVYRTRAARVLVRRALEEAGSRITCY